MSDYQSNRRFLLKIILPSLLAILLFISSMYVFIVPVFENNMLNQKRETIRELTQSAWTILKKNEVATRNGELSKTEAQSRAVSDISTLRYGNESKDYFWINDMKPRMVMHPYRQDLIGKNLSSFSDPHGKKLFVEAVKIVKIQGSGYLDYMWQWKDDSSKIVPKLSYVKGFEPWGWIIGTGVYIEDVRNEIATIENKLILISAGISIIITILLVFVIIQSKKYEFQKQLAEKALIESREKYKTLVESSTEGTAMLLGNKFVYTNIALTKILGYEPNEFLNIELADIFRKDNKSDFETFTKIIESSENKKKYEAKLVDKNKELVEVNLSLAKIKFGEKEGFTLIIKDLSGSKKIKEELGENKEKFKSLTNNINIGIFRTNYGRKAKFIEANPAAIEIFGFDKKEDLFKKNIIELFFDVDDKNNFFEDLQNHGNIKNRTIRLQKEDGSSIITSISATAVKDEKGNNKFCDGVIEDITLKKQAEDKRENLITELQTSQFFMNQPIRLFLRNILKCQYDQTIKKVASLLAKNDASSILIYSDSNCIGIITDNDLKKRVVATGFHVDKPISEIMTAPVVTINESALIYEAILLMYDKKIRHLAIKNDEGEIIGMISDDELRLIQIRSSSFIAQNIERAQDINEIIESYNRLPELIRAMIESGANAKNITRIITKTSDLIVKKLNEFAIQELGPPPAKYSFFVLGSEGREEATLLTDQDNAIIYENIEEEKQEAAKQYFDKLGNKVCDWLNDIGYNYCKGEIMAKNPKWCQPLSKWKNYFKGWITSAEPQDLLDINIFFDYRCVYGDTKLMLQLRDYIELVTEKNQQFFIYMAGNTLKYKLPITPFGNIILNSSGPNKNTFDIKEALIPVISFARIYSHKNKISATNTLKRLEILYEKHVVQKSTLLEFQQVYNHLMQIRLQHQAELISHNKLPNNRINPKNMTSIRRSILKKVFNQTSHILSKLSFDFLGGRG